MPDRNERLYEFKRNTPNRIPVKTQIRQTKRIVNEVEQRHDRQCETL